MSDIKIFVTHTPNRDTVTVDNPLFYNVIAGSDFQTKPVAEGMFLDNQGENISAKNKSYCELTTQYWAWKNQEADYYGFCHYRRFFSFNKNKLPEDEWGTLVYPVVNDETIEDLCMDAETMKNCIEQYDFLISEEIPTKHLLAKSVYEHYAKAPELHIEDVKIFLDVIKEKYPDVSETAEEFFKGKKFYPCNMFIMKKDLFQEYSAMLFDILEEFEKRADMSLYSREGYRTTGHLGERMAGIFYEYIKKRGGYKQGELQIALIQHADKQVEVTKQPESGVIPVVLAANEYYVPILYTCAQSIVNHASEANKYEIYIFHTDITMDSQKKFCDTLERENVHFVFINVLKYVASYKLQAKEHITTETFYRFLILDILKVYPKVLYLDCDMIIMRDVAELFHMELGDNLIGAVKDPDFMGQCNGANPDTKEYCDKVLKLGSPYKYFQAGVLLMNVEGLNKVTSVTKLLEMSDTGIYKYSDQDILNVLCEDRVKYLDMSWNMIVDCNHERWHKVIKFAPYYIMDEYEEARKHPYIIHYAGWLKPWMKPDEDFGEEFWRVARTNEFYETLLYRMGQRSAADQVNDVFWRRSLKHKLFGRYENKLRTWAKKVLPKGSVIRNVACNVYWKLK